MGDFDNDVAAINSIEAVPAILDVVCQATGMRFAAVVRVTDERWVACSVRDQIQFGLKPGGELPLETTICHEVCRNRAAVAIDHVAEDDAYRDHPTPAIYGFQSYISVPIIQKNGTLFGTLCAIDPLPAHPKRADITGMFKLFADLIAADLELADRLKSSETSLKEERAIAELRDQFIAVLGHDLRNPLAAIDACGRMLTKTPLNEKATQLIGLLHGSVDRMTALINDVLDFARGKLGGGLTVQFDGVEALEPMLNQVISELRGDRDRVIETEITLISPVNCDRPRIAQLFSNLLGNALTHGDANMPIRVRAISRETVFELSVSNGGEPIPSEAMKQLFQPFTRGAMPSNRQGLGLGLYIAAEIARAHGGEITVISSHEETRFTFQMPLN